MSNTDATGPWEQLTKVTAERDALKAERKKLVDMMNDAALAAGHDGYDEETELWRSVCSHLDRFKKAASDAIERASIECVAARKEASEHAFRCAQIADERDAEKERRCVAESQVENADINLQQVRMALRAQLDAAIAYRADARGLLRETILQRDAEREARKAMETALRAQLEFLDTPLNPDALPDPSPVVALIRPALALAAKLP